MERSDLVVAAKFLWKYEETGEIRIRPEMAEKGDSAPWCNVDWLEPLSVSRPKVSNFVEQTPSLQAYSMFQSLIDIDEADGTLLLVVNDPAQNLHYRIGVGASIDWEWVGEPRCIALDFPQLNEEDEND